MSDLNRYLSTQPPISSFILNSKIGQMQKIRTPDGMILSNLLKLCYICALKKNELINLRVRDVLDDKKNIRENIIIGGTGEVEVISRTALLIEAHFTYLKQKRYRTSRFAPFFPDRKNRKYSPRKLQYDLDQILKGDDHEKITLEKVRQSGICKFYDEQKTVGQSAAECLSQTASFARVKTTYHVKRILTGSIQQPGTRMSPFGRGLQDIEYFISFTGKQFDALLGFIECASDLNDAEKEILKEMLKNAISINSHN
jgi:integrase